MMGVSAYLAWREAARALETELDEKAAWVARAAVATGLQASIVIGLQPGFEDENAWQSYHFRLRELLLVVREAYILRSDNTALVTRFSADSIPIGAPLTQFEFEGPKLEEARRIGYASSEGFTGNDGRFYKWGFAALEDSETVLAVLMPADYLVPLERLRRNLIIGALAAALLAAVLAALLATSVVRPLERLSRVAIRIQRGRMEEPVAEEGGHEVGRLSRRWNACVSASLLGMSSLG
jgi:HAMP domain-containing protein